MDSSGSAGGPSILGTGMYVAPQYNIDPSQFNNPNYQPGAYQTQANRYLGATTQPVIAQTAGPASTGTTNTGINGELGVAGQYGQIASGNGPSLATATARQAGAQNLQNAESMLGSARGAGNPATAQLQAKTAQATGANQIAQNEVQGRTAEELGALGAEGGLYNNVAGQGTNQQQVSNQLSEYNAGQGNQVGMSNQTNVLGANTNFLNNTANQGLANQQGIIAGQQLGVQQQLGLGNIGEKAYEDSAKQNTAVAGAVMQGVGGLAGGFI